MRRGAGKGKTENEKDAVPEGEETANQDNGDTVVSASGGESDSREDQDKNTASTTAKKRKGKRGKKEESAPKDVDEDVQNAEPAEKKAKRPTRNVNNSTKDATDDQGEEYEITEDLCECAGFHGRCLIYWYLLPVLATSSWKCIFANISLNLCCAKRLQNAFKMTQPIPEADTCITEDYCSSNLCTENLLLSQPEHHPKAH